MTERDDRSRIMALFIGLLAAAPFSWADEPAAEVAAPPATMRVDFYHSGDAGEEHFSLDRVVIEPLPWPGNPAPAAEDLGLGPYRFEVRDTSGGGEGGALRYSRGFASIFAEWQTTAEAERRWRTFHASLRFPRPDVPVEVTVARRDAANVLRPVWTFAVDPDDTFVDTSTPPPLPVTAIAEHGPAAGKVDLLFLGDGYTEEQCPTFEDQARRLAEALFDLEPFRSRRRDFNVRAICPPAAQSGVSRPSTGSHRRSPLGVTYDVFGSERYALTYDNRALRETASLAPYEFLTILINSEVYGGGGIFGLYATVAAGNDWAGYLFVHEFGHHFAALADEYYTSSVAYQPAPIEVEPWERNVTALLDGELKWAELATPGVAVPTPWPKSAYERHAARIREAREAIRARNAPEAEMSALFRRQQAWETEHFGLAEHAIAVGAFEGANYRDRGYYRPQIDCVMFSRNRVPFCAVCQRALEAVIDRYAAAPVPPP